MYGRVLQVEAELAAERAAAAKEAEAARAAIAAKEAELAALEAARKAAVSPCRSCMTHGICFSPAIQQRLDARMHGS